MATMGNKMEKIHPLILLRLTLGSGISRIARTILRRLTRQEEITTIANVATMPSVNAMTKLCQLA